MNASQPTFHAVVLGLSPTGLYAVRELGKAGARLLGVDFGPATSRASKYFERGSTWSVEDIDSLLPRLLAHAASTGQRPFLLATSDIFIEWMIVNAAALRAAFDFPRGYETTAPELLDKVRFHALCARHAVETPGIWQAADRAELKALAGAVPFPCILKPVLIHRAKEFLKGHKVLIARTREQFEVFVASIPDDSGAWFVQEIIKGPESEITLCAGYVDSQGLLRQSFTARKLRQYPAGFGSASLVISEPNSETADICGRFITATGYRGIFGAELKRDLRDGRLKMIEINPRPTLWFQLTHAAGKRVALAAAWDLQGQDAPPDEPQSNGVQWRYFLKDMASASFYAFKGRSFVFPAPNLHAAGPVSTRCWPVFDAADAMPALVEPLLYLAKAFKRHA